MFGTTVDPQVSAAMTMQEAEDWFKQVSSDTSGTHWAIEYKGRFIGTARLHSLNVADRRARYAVGILDPAVLGIGLGEEVTRTVLGYGFGALDLHRIDLRVLEYNERAIRCYRRCGFVEEGREREAALVSGRWYDDVAMSILEHEWLDAARR